MFIITDVNIETETIYVDNEVVDIIVVGYDVKFQMGEIIGSVMVFTDNKRLTIHEIKEKIQDIINNYLQKGDD